jgi:hypothetical protein
MKNITEYEIYEHTCNFIMIHDLVNYILLCLWVEEVDLMNINFVTGYDEFGGVDFEGTFFVDTEIDDDYVGFIFR